MTVTHYNSSKGPVPIAGMAFPHLSSAIAKMEREGKTGEPEYPVMVVRRDAEEAGYVASKKAEPVTEVIEERVVTLGDNNPPESTPFEIIKAKIEDIRIEAINWMDGTAIATAAEAKEVERLQDMLKDAMAEAEEAKATEKKPFMDAANEVQNRYNTLTGKTQTVTGSALVIDAAIKTALTKWRNKVESERLAEVDRLAKIAKDQADKAAELFRSSVATSDLTQREESIAEIDKAKEAAHALKTVERAVTKGLRTVHGVTVTDGKALAAWMWVNRKEMLLEFMTQEALRTVRASSGLTVINGVTNTVEKVAV